MHTAQGTAAHAADARGADAHRADAVVAQRSRWPGLIGALAALCLSAASAQAATVLRASPQGEVRQLRQFSVTFDQAAVPLGDGAAAAPFKVTCQGDAPAGTGRWANERTWTYNFEADVGPGVRCVAEPMPGLRGLPVRFQTGGPAVLRSTPARGTVHEDATFLLRLNGRVDEASVRSHARCEVEGIGERIPVQLLGGAVREAVLKQQHVAPADAERTLLLACQRPLPPGARMRLVWGQGIASQGAHPVLSRQDQVFDFTVRAAFTAEFSCERERAHKPCMPLRPLLLNFSAEVPRKLAEQVRLKPASGEAIAPFFAPDDREAEVSQLRFKAPLPESTAFTLVLPKALRDVDGRELANAGSFPLKVATAEMPPLAKFAAAPFGVVELLGEPGQPPLVPLTVRHVERQLQVKGSGALGVKSQTVSADRGDREILQWMAKVQRHHESSFSARELGRPKAEWLAWVTETDDDGQPKRVQRERRIGSRELSLLDGVKASQTLTVPSADAQDPRPFEVVGIPLSGPGYHVVEVSSPRLGAALLAQPAPMYVRTGVLVSNLSVHAKLGRDNALVWVTSLDKGKPVRGAEVGVSDCTGTRLWSGRTDAQGLARIEQRLVVRRDAQCLVGEGLFVTARHAMEEGLSKGQFKGQTDLAFVFTDWQKGIEPWRFNHPTQSPGEEGVPVSVRAHTVLDRSLLRAGETVSMKHLLRAETARGLGAVPRAQWPDKLIVTHLGSGTQFTQALSWSDRQQALSTWTIPKDARLGQYDIDLEGPSPAGRRTLNSGSFRVEAFRVPLVDARLMAPKGVQIAPREVVLGVQLRYLSGGGMAQSGARLTAVTRERTPSFPGYEAYRFEAPAVRGAQGSDLADGSSGDGEAQPSRWADRMVADKLPVATDREGAATVTLPPLPALRAPSDLHAELSYTDPNGEVQTVARTVPLWPSAVVLGLRTPSWVGSGRGEAGAMRFQVVALDTQGRPLAQQKVAVQARVVQTLSHRKRIVGGFYAYDNREEITELGEVCAGQTDARGLLLCETRFAQAGEVELVAQAQDAQSHRAQAAASVWVTRQGEVWFGQDNDDRMDVLPEQRSVEPGQTARLQVRMPFREATAWVTIEREGIIDTRVMSLSGKDPVIELPIPKGRKGADGEVQSWAPNVYVSVMAVRGRLRDVPWYSFFTWGWREPWAWAKAFWYEGREYQAPTALVDLSRPAYKLGVASLQVGVADHALKVEVLPDQPQYSVRQTATARVRVTQGGQPVQGDIAFAAVDEGLLALSDNASWQVLDAFFQPRPWGVETSTAQNEIIGRRHFGRKAVAAGGGGGQGATRELLDTLLIWRGSVPLDARGEAVVKVPINDSLTRFKLVAVATSGLSRYGTGSASIRVTQDLQALPGLPPLVREGDRFEAIATLRNTTARAMKVSASLVGQGAAAETGAAPVALKLPAQQLDIPPDGAREVRWPVAVPQGVATLRWTLSVDEAQGKAGVAAARDRVLVTQSVQPAVPVQVRQSTLVQLGAAPLSLAVAPPPEALLSGPPGASRAQGGLRIALQATLGGGLPGVKRFFEGYPHTCLEQQASRAIGLRDAQRWSELMQQLPTHLDGDGLAAYFPLQEGAGPQGSVALTAYLLSISHEAGWRLPDETRERLLTGLSDVVQGRIRRSTWAPSGVAQAVVNDVQRVNALDALSRHGRADARMLDTVSPTLGDWPTAAVIQWWQVLQRLPAALSREARMKDAEQTLRSRLTYSGTTLRFSTEAQDFWWWTMDSADANAARLILAVRQLPAWKGELPRLVVGALGRQRNGAWLTTPANAWGTLALERFGQQAERTPISGRSVVKLAAAEATLDWASAPTGQVLALPWPVQAVKGGAPASQPLQLRQDGTGAPWATVQALSAVPLKAPVQAGYAVRRTVSVVDAPNSVRPSERGAPYARGTVLRVTLEIDAQADMNWVAVQDPIPGGATLLGSGLGRDSHQATRGEQAAGAWPSHVERAQDAWRAYYAFLPKGRHRVDYTVRLNNPGRFNVPPTRVEAMYAPDSFGESPQPSVEVAP